jgi:serine/threonine-protein kinase
MSTFSLRDGLLIAGRYRIVKPLGRGAYGAVYEALRSGDSATVALKIMHAIHAETTDALRFERESELLKRLESPYVVRILDFGHHEEMPFLVFEHLAGRTVAEELAALGAFGAVRTARIARQILYALEAAHALSIVHRDIKPANIFLCEGREDHVKVLDFGIAKALGDDVGAALTATGQMLGTAQYMAPEQVRGETVDERVDLYSLGTVMGEMLTGERVVGGENEIEVYMQHVSDRPLELPPAVRASPLGGTIQRALGKRPDDRYPSAAAMGAELDRLLTGGGLERVAPAPRARALSSDPDAPRVSAHPIESWELDDVAVAVEGDPQLRALEQLATPHRFGEQWSEERARASHPEALVVQVPARSSSGLGWVIVLCVLLAAAGGAAVFLWWGG